MIVIVLVALGEAADPSTQALTSAAQEGLGPSAIVVVREASSETLETHAEPERTGELLHADAVATVVWSDPTHLHAHVAVFSEQDHAWQDRSVTFGATDAEIDRGRQLGFGIASMVPLPIEPKASIPPHRDEALPATRPTPPSPERRIAIDLVGAGASGTAGGFGGELAARWRTWRTLWFRAGVGMRFGSIGAAQASFVDTRFDGGPALTLFSSSSVELSLRSDFVATRIAVSREASSVNSSGARFVAGVDLLAEGALDLARNFAIVAAAGAELDFGSTQIIVDGAEVDRAAQLRALAEIGARMCF